MKVRMNRRGTVRCITFSLAVFAVSVIFAITGWVGYIKQKQINEYGFQRSLLSLSESVDGIDVTLKKTLCAGSAEQFAALAAKLCTDAAAAKSELGQLPASVGELNDVNRFISQVADYAVSLSNKRYLDEDLTEKELEQMRNLEKYTAKLRLTLDELIARSADSNLWPGSSKTLIDAKQKDYLGNVSDNSLDVMADDFTDYPTLIYDGPFSDHLYDKKAELIKDKIKVSKEKAKETAEKFSVKSEIEFLRSIEGNLPLYVFGAEGIEVGVTVQGGHIAYMINSRSVNSSRLDEDDAEKIAERYLREHGFDSVYSHYYEINSNCCVMNFTPIQNGTVIYPDMIKISVALDNGEVVEFDAGDYIMNHRDRGAFSPQKTKKEARDIVSRQLEIEDVRLALIPAGGKNEVLCWEFLCEADDDTEVLVYVNSENLKEEKILLIVDNENGKLTV